MVMGHIDHGKTTLLDFIRKSNVTAKESGGITQHIGAYEVVHGERKITFLDTPGHESFSKMRSRGAKVADLAILVVAADDGVKPQTKEAIAAINQAGIPFVVAVNKMDKPAADPERVARELGEQNIYLEGRGGNVPWVPVSAKAGTGIDQLLETLLLLSDLEELKARPSGFAEGVVIESHLDSKRGIAATLLVRAGTLKKSEYVLAGHALAKTRIMEDYKGSPVEFAGPSSPVAVVGFDKLPLIGSGFRSYFSQKDALDAQRKFVEEAKKEVKTIGDAAHSADETVICLVIKGDTEGSVEALKYEAEKLKMPGLQIKFLRSAAGEVSEDDIKLASSALHPLVLSFRAPVSGGARELAEKISIKIASFDIIYDAVDFLRAEIKTMLPVKIEVKISGRAKIAKIFKDSGKKKVVGGRVFEGVIKKGSRFVVLRRENKVGEGKFENLQSNKANMDEVSSPDEFGALVSSTSTLVAGDILEVFLEVVHQA